MEKGQKNLVIDKELKYLRKCLDAGADPGRAVKEKAYLKSPYKFRGVSLPGLDKIAREFWKRNLTAKPEYVFAITGSLWDSRYHEEKNLSIKILQRYPQFLGLPQMEMLEEMIEGSTGWDHLDRIAVRLVGEVLAKESGAFGYLEKWGRSVNFWVRRASLISQIVLFRDGRGDHGLFFRLAENMIDEREFFIRKAIGWTLREMSKADPDLAFEFLMKVKGSASGLTLREGSKRLPEKMRKKVMEKHGKSRSFFDA